MIPRKTWVNNKRAWGRVPQFLVLGGMNNPKKLPEDGLQTQNAGEHRRGEIGMLRKHTK